MSNGNDVVKAAPWDAELRTADGGFRPVWFRLCHCGKCVMVIGGLDGTFDGWTLDGEDAERLSFVKHDCPGRN